LVGRTAHDRNGVWADACLGPVPVRTHHADLDRIAGERQDLSQFAGLQGNLGALLIFLAVSWTLAAVGEEIVYRGYLPLRITDMFGASTVGILAAVVLSSMLFGLAHTEQGTIGVILTFLDALFFSFLRWRLTKSVGGRLATDSTTP